MLLAAFVFSLVEVWVFLAAFASPEDPSRLAWETVVSLLAFGFWSYQGTRILLQTPGRRAMLVLLAGVVLGACLAVTIPLRRLEDSPYSINVHKAARTLELFRGTELVGTYKVGLGGSPKGDKAAEGDLRTPEGDFTVTDRMPSQFHKWLGLSYPDSGSAWQGRLQGKITWPELWYIRVRDLNAMIPYSRSALGGDVGIHGGGSKRDWTLGCVALENDDVDKVYALVRPGTRVRILP